MATSWSGVLRHRVLPGSRAEDACPVGARTIAVVGCAVPIVPRARAPRDEVVTCLHRVASLRRHGASVGFGCEATNKNSEEEGDRIRAILSMGEGCVGGRCLSTQGWGGRRTAQKRTTAAAHYIRGRSRRSEGREAACGLHSQKQLHAGAGKSSIWHRVSSKPRIAPHSTGFTSHASVFETVAP